MNNKEKVQGIKYGNILLYGFTPKEILEMTPEQRESNAGDIAESMEEQKIAKHERSMVDAIIEQKRFQEKLTNLKTPK